VIRLVLLGRLRDHAGASHGELTLPADIRTLSALQDWLGAREPALAEALQTVRPRIAINRSLVRDLSHPIRDGDEVAFLPPMSGG
jgi:molybdopterin synthase sulfur carrier subunit